MSAVVRFLAAASTASCVVPAFLSALYAASTFFAVLYADVNVDQSPVHTLSVAAFTLSAAAICASSTDVSLTTVPSNASSAPLIASSAASLIAVEVRVAPLTVDHPLMLSSVAS